MVHIEFAVNSSPFTGNEGRWSTSRKPRERLFNELRTIVSLRVEETDSADRFNVSGRGHEEKRAKEASGARSAPPSHERR